MYYIVTEERRSWGKYLVEASSEAEALQNYGDVSSENYLGEVDAVDSEVEVAAGPFENKKAALSSTEAAVI